MPEPETGELYAVYFGTAFHLGVFIGNGEIVHYLNDNHVYRVTWEQFLENRVPQHWTYPDLEPVPVETIVATALSEVGKTYPYNLLTFNCENFAIFCKSGGKTKYSKYAQVASGVETVAAHPLIGAGRRAEHPGRGMARLPLRRSGGKAAFADHPPDRRRGDQLAHRHRPPGVGQAADSDWTVTSCCSRPPA